MYLFICFFQCFSLWTIMYIHIIKKASIVAVIPYTWYGYEQRTCQGAPQSHA